jgi:hypothetical protein
MFERIRPPGTPLLEDHHFIAERQQVVGNRQRGQPAPMQATRLPFLIAGGLRQAREELILGPRRRA